MEDNLEDEQHHRTPGQQGGLQQRCRPAEQGCVLGREGVQLQRCNRVTVYRVTEYRVTVYRATAYRVTVYRVFCKELQYHRNRKN